MSTVSRRGMHSAPIAIVALDDAKTLRRALDTAWQYSLAPPTVNPLQGRGS